MQRLSLSFGGLRTFEEVRLGSLSLVLDLVFTIVFEVATLGVKERREGQIMLIIKAAEGNAGQCGGLWHL